MKLTRTLSAPLAAALGTALLLVSALVAVPATAQQADAVLRDFVPSGDYIVKIDGEEAPTAELYQSGRVPAFLIVANELSSPTLILPRERAVQTVSFMKLSKRGDGTLDILADAQLTPVGSFRLEGRDVAFSVDGKEVSLVERPYLLGEQDLQAMLDYSPAYRRGADDYDPEAAAVQAIAGADDAVKVRVYFGSWCGFCKTYVPKMLAVAEQLKGEVEFEFYGLPNGFGDEPAARRDGIDSVPTGIVYVGGKEVGRLNARDWENPEGSLRNLVTGT